MSKTITLRIDNETYDLIKLAATGQRRTISNFIEYATMAYLSEDSFVSDEEMEEILEDEKLLKTIIKAEKEIESGKYRIVG